MRSIFFVVCLATISLSYYAQAQKMAELGNETETVVYKPKKLFKKSIGNFLNVSLPKDFTEMSETDIAKKYPSYIKPLILYTNPDRTVDFGFNISRNIWGNDLPMLKKFYKSTILNLFQKVTFIQDTIATFNGRTYVMYEFVSSTENKEMDKKLPPIKNYSYFLYTIEKNRILVVMFNSPAAVRKEWAPTAAKIIQSLALNTQELDQKIAEFNSKKMNKSKSPKEVLEDMKKKEAKVAPADSAKKVEAPK